MIPAEQIKAAHATNILATAMRYTKLKRVGANEHVGPCPHCGGRDRFGVNVRKRVFNCRGCGAKGDVIALVQLAIGASFGEAIAELTGEAMATDHRPQPRQPDPLPEGRNGYSEQQHRKAAWLWSQRQSIGGTIAETDLRGKRRIICPLPVTLAFLPPYKPEHHPAMIAAFALPDEPESGLLGEPRNVAAVHLTLLKPDGSDKAAVEQPKVVVGSPGEVPIALAPVNDLGGLAIAEGIEDALTVHQATGLGAWAAGCAGHLPAMAETVPPYVESVTVLIDNDPAGRRGAEGLAQLLCPRILEVRPANLTELRGAP